MGLSQKEFGDLVGKSMRTIQSIEGGKLKLGWETAFKIGRATQEDANWLMCKTDKRGGTKHTSPMVDTGTLCDHVRAISARALSRNDFRTVAAIHSKLDSIIRNHTT